MTCYILNCEDVVNYIQSLSLNEMQTAEDKTLHWILIKCAINMEGMGALGSCSDYPVVNPTLFIRQADIYKMGNLE